jgi:hypothetical protein
LPRNISRPSNDGALPASIENRTHRRSSASVYFR